MAGVFVCERVNECDFKTFQFTHNFNIFGVLSSHTHTHHCATMNGFRKLM